MSTRLLRTHRHLGPIAHLAVASLVLVGSAACGTTDFAAAVDASVDGSTKEADAKTGADTGHQGGDSGKDATASDAGKHDAKAPVDTGTEPDTGAGDDTGTGTDAGSPKDAGVDQGGPACAMGSCTSAESCLPPAGACKEAACTAGCCTTADKAAETACTNATGGNVCDGAGVCVDCVSNNDCTNSTEPYCVVHECVACRTANDCPTPSSDCETRACSASGVCTFPDVTKGTPCSGGGGKVCDGFGNCVGCTTAADCGTPPECETFACAEGSCDSVPESAGSSCGAAGSGMICNGSGGCCTTTVPASCTVGG